MQLEALMYPSSVAVVGASRSPEKVGHAVLNNLIKDGFQGEIIPVNPSADEILGLKTYPAIGDYEGKIDLAILVVPTQAVKAALQAALDKGVGAVTVITAGFKEIGPEGAEMERELARICNSRRVPMLGPNVVGLINTHHHMNASFATQMPAVGDISVVSQSGALAGAILDTAAGRNLGLDKLLSIGNKAVLTETELLAALGDDEHTRVIVGYLEDIINGDEFIETAGQVGARKPVVVMKVGTTQAGARAAVSHTGSMAGGDIAYSAAFKRAGVVRADSFEALFDYATAFSMQPLPKGKRVAIVTNSGGPGIMAADAVETAGLEVAALSDQTTATLRENLSSMAAVGNPVDVLGDAGHERYGMALRAVADDPGVDAVVALWTPVAMTAIEDTAKAIADSRHPEKPVVAAFLGEENVVSGRAELRTLGVPDYPSPERAVLALKAMTGYVAWRERPPRVVTRFAVNRRRVERVIRRQRRTGRNEIGEARSKDLLAAYEFIVPEGRLARSADEAVEVASQIGYPVALKVASPDILHKSDIGGVKLRLASREAVCDAYDLMMLRIADRMPKANVEGAYVERMVPRGREVIIGMTRDPQFGPMLMFGLGGIFVEVMKDVSFYLAPITAEEAMQMLMGTRSYALLRGVRGESAVDLTAIAESLQRISQLATDFPEIAELDINPLIVGPVGTEPVVADARIILTPSDTEAGETA